MRYATIIAFGFAAGLAASKPSLAEELNANPELFARGMDLYLENCAVCHGDNGDGKGSLATGFTPRPTDFTTGAFKIKSSEPGEFPTQQDIMATITLGITGSYGTTMPSFVQFSPEELTALAEIVRVAAGAPEFGTSVIVPERPANADPARGEQLYRELGCIDCHGENGDAQGVLAGELVDAQGQSILPADFRTGEFKGGNEPTDTWTRIYTGLEGTPMPSFSQIASGDDIWALVDYIEDFKQ
jgi:cytochrome c oxidase cbb3-type subunit I/II